MTAAQVATLDKLTSYIDDLSSWEDDRDGGAVVFEGDAPDGPAMGYVEPDGEITWVAGS